jgi:hypothetical protein
VEGKEAEKHTDVRRTIGARFSASHPFERESVCFSVRAEPFGRLLLPTYYLDSSANAF